VRKLSEKSRKKVKKIYHIDYRDHEQSHIKEFCKILRGAKLCSQYMDHGLSQCIKHDKHKKRLDINTPIKQAKVLVAWLMVSHLQRKFIRMY
jgi:hypothetical protein